MTVIVTSGDPSGIGPDICLDIPKYFFSGCVIIGDIELLRRRADMLNMHINIIDVHDVVNVTYNVNTLYVYHIQCPYLDCIGKLEVNNTPYVIAILDTAISLCRQYNLPLVTGPVNKAIINDYGICFTGHTEYLMNKFAVNKTVMMFHNCVKNFNLSLLTTHVAVAQVSQFITQQNLDMTLNIILEFFANLGNHNPKIAICGLNPHAGERGAMGREEIDIINPVIAMYQDAGYTGVTGSYSADTIFCYIADFDMILAMYHDQGLPVMKFIGFEDTINVTLGLPIIRTSVDHGTALSLAGTGKSSSRSLMHAIEYAMRWWLRSAWHCTYSR